VAILNPRHFFDQADRLITPVRGAPRQVDLRRAISNAYYGLFHAASIAAADEFVGKTKQSEAIYALVYRSIQHRTLRQLCEDIGRPTIPSKYQPYLPPRGLSHGLAVLARTVVDLQAKRHAADYDPMLRLSVVDAQMAVRTAKLALTLFEMVRRSRRVFLLLLLFPPR
jgi:hypothetical protein